MHNSTVPAAVLDRVFAVRGSQDNLLVDPPKTAHVVIDLQIGFMGQGALAEIPLAREIVDDVNRISQALRNAGGTVVFVQFKYDPTEPHHWGPMFDRMTPEALARFQAAFAEGAEQHRLWPGLDIQSQDLIVSKTRFSAFIPGTSDLDGLLRERGVDTLIITGTMSNCCCESTARDAMQMGYKVLFVQDANATDTDEAHNATLSAMAGLFFADVVTSSEAIARIEATPTAAAT